MIIKNWTLMTCQNIFGKEQAIMDLIKIVFQVFVKYHFKLFFFSITNSIMVYK